MNNESEMNPFDAQPPDEPNWGEVFGQAAETPPPRVWNAIERRLDDDRTGLIVPLWSAGLTRFTGWAASGMAAAVALLVVGWWLLRPTPSPSAPASVLAQSADSQKEIIKTSEPAVTATDTRLATKGELTTSNNHPADRNRQLADATTLSRMPGESRQRSTSARLVALVSLPLVEPVVKMAHVSEVGIESPKFRSSDLAASGSVSEVAGTNKSFILSKLTIQPMRFSGVPLTRILWVAPATELEPVALIDKPKSSRERWASVGVGSGAFGAGMALPGQSAVMANSANALMFRSASVAGPSPVLLANRPLASVAVAVAAGWQLSSRWSAETGVTYLMARSEVISPGQVLAYSVSELNIADLVQSSREPSSFYTDLVQNSRLNRLHTPATASDRAAFAPNAVRFEAGKLQTDANDYQYVQVPVQVGYELRPRRKFGIALLGGVLANLFVKNTVANSLTINAKDGVYEPLSFAGSGGLRLRYRTAKRWSASLAGSYQRALSLTTRPGAEVIARPELLGLSMGLDYHF